MIDINKILEKSLGDSFTWFGDSLSVYHSKIIALVNSLEELNLKQPNEYDIMHCLSDSYLLLEDYEKAYFYCPKPELKQKWSLLANRRLNLSIRAFVRYDVNDLLTLYSKKITKYGIENLGYLSQILDILLADWEKDNNHGLLHYFLSKNDLYQKEHPIYNGTLFSKYFKNQFLFYEFSECTILENLVIDFSRRAENIVREERGIPSIGEGWIAETDLYYQIKNQFPEYDVSNHFSISWLGKQHFDIYIPNLKLAIEYQGLQHDKPVEYFGGETAFIKQQQRDKKKINLCRRHGVKILYVREGYKFEDICDEIELRTKELAT